MPRQSTRNLILIEPSSFGYNPETATTNAYQRNAQENWRDIGKKAVAEFRGFRDMLVEAGATVTTFKGPEGCPDAVFPHGFSTHDDGIVYLYPMHAPSRRRERTAEQLDFLRKFYTVKDDLLGHEADGRALESTGSMVLDRVGRVAYIGRSLRTDEKLARDWCAREGYEPIIFDTVGHDGKPVYHTDLVLWIGSEIAGIGTGVIVEADRNKVLQSLSRTREVIEFDNAQIRGFCGNAIEIRGADDQPLLVMSDTAYGLLSSAQLSRLNVYYGKILHAPLDTIEIYGGGSARCVVQELF